MKIRKKLNEELLEEYAEIIIPINVKFRTTSDDEDEVVYYEEDKITHTLEEEFEDTVCVTIDRFLDNKESEIIKQLNKEIHIMYAKIHLDEYNNVLSADGQITISLDYEGSLDESSIKEVFNTLLNDALINDEITIEYESDEYGEFDIIAEINKVDNIEIEGF